MPLSAAEHEAIIANGQCAYSVSWDTGSPFGGSGCWKVFALNGVYAVSLDDGEGTGPYSSLREAIVATEELYIVGSATTEIESKELKIDEIISLLKRFEGEDESELQIKINGEVHTIPQG